MRSLVLLASILLFAFASAAETIYEVQPGDTLYRIAEAFDVSVGEIATANALADVDRIEVGQRLRIPGPIEWPEALPPPFQEVALEPPEATQGQVQVLTVVLAPGARLTSVRYLGAEIPIAPSGSDGSYRALLVTPVLQDPGRAALALEAETAAGPAALDLPVSVRDGAFAREEIWLSAETSSLLEPSIVAAEHALVGEICAAPGPEPLWQGSFRHPVDAPEFTSRFGTLRSYNGGPYRNFHRGLDYRGGIGTPVYAPAGGVVTLSEELHVRGQAVILNHGLGVCSGYLHLSERVVEVGQRVESGQLLGYVGDTGLVTGPHLHWEVRVGGVPVAPLQWVEEGVRP